MSTEIKVPTLPESIADALIVTWHKKPGDAVRRDDVLVDVETDKVVLEVPASEDGVLGPIIEDEGATVTAQQIIGSIEAGTGAAAADDKSDTASEAAASTPAAQDVEEAGVESGGQTSPAVRKLLTQHDLKAEDVKGSGKNGRISKEDVEAHVATSTAAAAATPSGSAASAPAASTASAMPRLEGDRSERRVPMTRLRARIAERLLSATQSTAMLTTFNEVDMSGFIALRSQYKDGFEKSHGVKLGFMSIFLRPPPKR